ncbi:hypothetical protein Bbelb_426520 [Branchiostoma belcheri]|nr:hypothetical protein Bbelb_426520 [Branchiostoma belcheri]
MWSAISHGELHITPLDWKQIAAIFNNSGDEVSIESLGWSQGRGFSVLARPVVESPSELPRAIVSAFLQNIPSRISHGPNRKKQPSPEKYAPSIKAKYMRMKIGQAVAIADGSTLQKETYFTSPFSFYLRTSGVNTDTEAPQQKGKAVGTRSPTVNDERPQNTAPIWRICQISPLLWLFTMTVIGPHMDGPSWCGLPVIVTSSSGSEEP